MFPLSWSHSSLQLPMLCSFLVGERLAYKTIRLQSCLLSSQTTILPSLKLFQLCQAVLEWIHHTQYMRKKNRNGFGRQKLKIWLSLKKRGADPTRGERLRAEGAAQRNMPWRGRWIQQGPMPGSRGLSWHMGCPGTCASSGGTAPVPGSSTRLTALVLPSQAPSVSAHRRWGAKRGQRLTHRPHLRLSSSSFHPHPTPLTLRIRLSLCHQSPAPAEEQTDKLCLAFLLINRLVNFFPYVFFPPLYSPDTQFIPYASACVCVCQPKPSLFHPCNVSVAVLWWQEWLILPIFFIPACSGDHACWDVLQKEWSLFYEISLSYGLFDSYEECKLITLHTGGKHEKFPSLLVFFLSVWTATGFENPALPSSAAELPRSYWWFSRDNRVTVTHRQGL